jgi:hypothetical protein
MDFLFMNPAWLRDNRFMSFTRVPSVVIACAVALAALQAQAPATGASSLAGAWTLNRDSSDKPPADGEDRREGEGRRRGGPGGGGPGGGGGHRGGFGGGGFGGPGSTGGTSSDGRTPEDIQRMRNALRDELQPPEHLTIVETGTTIIMTAGDGRTTRLSADGKKIKDENTNVERKTKRDGGKLVSEVTGLRGGKITETYTVDDEHKQLRVTLEIEGRDRKATTTRVYDADTR